MIKTLYLDRASYMAWVDGVLLDRRGDSVLVGDNVKHDQSEQVLREGGRVILTIDGEPVSEMIETEDGYYERELETGT